MAPICRYSSTSSLFRQRARSNSVSSVSAGQGYPLNRTYSVPSISNYKPTWSSVDYHYNPSRSSAGRFDDHWNYPGREYRLYHNYHYPRRYYYSSYVPNYTYTLYSYLPSVKTYGSSPSGYYNSYTCDTHYRSPFSFRSYLYSLIAGSWCLAAGVLAVRFLGRLSDPALSDGIAKVKMGLKRSRSISCALIGSNSVNPDPTPLTRTYSVARLPNYKPFWPNRHSYWTSSYPRGYYTDYRPNPQTSYYGAENYTSWFSPRPYYTTNTDSFLAAIRRDANPHRSYVHETSYRNTQYTPHISKSYYTPTQSYYWPTGAYNYNFVLY